MKPPTEITPEHLSRVMAKPLKGKMQRQIERAIADLGTEHNARKGG